MGSIPNITSKRVHGILAQVDFHLLFKGKRGIIGIEAKEIGRVWMSESFHTTALV